MKGKLFVLLLMVGIPTAAWVFLAWATMITLGILHSVCSVVPPLSFLESFLAALMLFGIILWRPTTRPQPAATTAAES